MKTEMRQHLGDRVIELWRFRDRAEFDVLASVALNPRGLWPWLTGGLRVDLSLFDCPQHRLLFSAFQQFHREGPNVCGQWCIKLLRFNRYRTEIVFRLFDTYPPCKSVVTLYAERLTRIANSYRLAERHLNAAGHAIDEAIAESIDPSRNKHALRRMTTHRAGVKASA